MTFVARLIDLVFIIQFTASTNCSTMGQGIPVAVHFLRVFINWNDLNAEAKKEGSRQAIHPV